MARMVIEADVREAGGKNVARRLRRDGRIPGILYGAGKEPVSLALDPRQVEAVFHSDSGHNTLLNVNVQNGETASAMIVDWQYEPVRGKLLHVDLKRIAMDRLLRVRVPVFGIGEAAGVKTQGGILEYVVREVEVECLPADIPEHIEADVTHLVIGMNLRARDLALGDKVRLISDADQVVLHVVALKEEVEEAKPVEGVEAAAPAEPEVIRKGKADKEEEVAEPAEGKKKEAPEAKKKEKEK